LKSISRLNLYSSDENLSIDNLIYSDLERISDFVNKGDLKSSFGIFYGLESKEDEIKIIEITKKYVPDFMIVNAKNWKIIPFENLISHFQVLDTELIAKVKDIDEAEILLKTLEIGVDGILYKPTRVGDLTKLASLLKTKWKLPLQEAEVFNIQNISEADRVCVDSTSLLRSGEGMLIGSTSKGFVLVHAEVFETEFVSSRPFRVNAGDVSSYILVPDETSMHTNKYKTKYLSELKGGDKVLVVDTQGNVREVTVGRVKIETRPMLRFNIRVQDKNQTISLSCVCQNAETIRLVDPEGTPVSVVDITSGDKVLIHLGPRATHFGTKIEENIIEK
jgi:3-dehydroquinate synthase II